MDKIKVLAICHEDPEFILGGMGRHVRELYQVMARHGDVDIDLLTSGPGEGAKQYLGYTKHQSDKFICYKPARANMTSLLTTDIQLTKTLMNLVAQGKTWDVIHVHEWNAFQVAKLASESLNIPMVGTMHLCISKLMQDCTLPTDFRHNWSEEDIYLMQQESNLVTQCDEFIVCSEAYKDIIREVFLTKRFINVIYNGIDQKYWNTMGYFEHEPTGSRTRPIALFVGRIADMKGIRPLLRAVETEDTGYKILLAGEINTDTEEQKEHWEVTKQLKSLQKRYPERIQWLGFKDDSELKALYTIADVGIMPSIHEPFGIVALEFMTNGVPLISTEVDGLKEIVVDECGNEYSLIIDANSPGQINAALKLLKNNDNVKNELSELGRKRANDFDWNKIAEHTVEIYRQAINKKMGIKNAA